MSCSVQQTLRSPFVVTRTLIPKLKVVWPAIPYFVPPILRIGGTNVLLSTDRTVAACALDVLASAYTLARHCHSAAVSRRLKFKAPFVDRQNPCANSCCLLP